MKEHEADLLKLLGAFARREAPEFREAADWPALIRLAELHRVDGVLADLAAEYPGLAPESLVPALRRHCKQTILHFALRHNQALALTQALDAAGIDHLVFKGFVVRDYYPIPELRTVGDYDLLIRPEDREASHRLMLELGFTPKTDWEPVYAYTRGIELYELHSRIMETDISPRVDCVAYFSTIWDHARVRQGRTWEPEPEYHFLYLLAHIAKHVHGSGAGLRMYLDLAIFFLHFGRDLDWAWVRGELESLGLWRFANAALHVVERMEVPIPLALEPLDPDWEEDFLAFTMAGGLFGRAAGDSGTRTLRNDDRAGETVSRGAALRHRLFPKAAHLEARYTYLQKRPWLLPAAWVHRLVLTRETWGAHAREAKQILSADEEEVTKLRAIYRGLDL